MFVFVREHLRTLFVNVQMCSSNFKMYRPAFGGERDTLRHAVKLVSNNRHYFAEGGYNVRLSAANSGLKYGPHVRRKDHPSQTSGRITRCLQKAIAGAAD